MQIIGVVYPIIKSLEALGTDESIEDDKQWLTYWIVFSLFSFIDFSGGFLMSLIPFYFLIKLLVLVWLQNPLTMGALVVYETVLVPFRKKYAS